MPDASQWTAIAAVATALQALVVIVAALYARNQVAEARQARADAKKSRDFQLLLQLHTVFDSDNAREDRRRLHNELPPNLGSELTRSQEDLVYRVVETFEFVGQLVRSGVLEFDLITETHARPISRNWQRLEPWIAAKRVRDPNFAEGCVDLGRQCLQWDVSRHGETAAKPYTHASGPQSLTETSATE